MTTLQQRIVACERCSLRQGCKAPVPYRNEGYKRGGLMLIGEAPGRTENQQGRPFVGPSGRLVESWLDILGVKEPWVTNIVRCWPHGPPTPLAIEACWPWLAEELRLARPSAILALGSTARKALSSKTAYLNDVGPRPGVPVKVFYLRHPAFFLRQGGKGWASDVLAIRNDLQDALKVVV